MSAPTDIKPVATPASLSLTADEQRILAAFRTMDAQGKRECLIRVEWTAEKWPERKRPTLRLVSTASPPVAP